MAHGYALGCGAGQRSTHYARKKLHHTNNTPGGILGVSHYMHAGNVVVWVDRMTKDRYGYLILLFILALILFACTLPAESGRMPGEYVLGEDGNGPIDVFWAGEFDNIQLYLLGRFA